ncbi:hypothetical protein JTE90_023976 [Oedothorax gibbosus]|uniref:DUF4145 domain-containing protein n=1 Tax=Oedothorax gibbosus TaxID=931172 RepID=A0AAV6UGA8_9ARAC|nr:hypothetical protein JTE90_023976 [Oedothorax gibbosus]
MKNTIKDVFCVSAIVDFITCLPKEHYQSSRITSSQQSRVTTATHYSRQILTQRVKNALKQMSTKYFQMYRLKLTEAKVYEYFNETVLSLELRLLRNEFSTVRFLKYCCQVGALASHASELGFKPASRLAEFYILRTVKKFRSKSQFSNDNWKYMDNVIGECFRNKIVK